VSSEDKPHLPLVEIRRYINNTADPMRKLKSTLASIYAASIYAASIYAASIFATDTILTTVNKLAGYRLLSPTQHFPFPSPISTPW